MATSFVMYVDRSGAVPIMEGTILMVDRLVVKYRIISSAVTQEQDQSF